MPLYKGSSLVAGDGRSEGSNGDSNIEFKILQGTTATEENVAALNDAWMWRAAKTSIICLYENNILEIGIIRSDSSKTITLTSSGLMPSIDTVSSSTAIRKIKKLQLVTDENGQQVTSFSVVESNDPDVNSYLATNVNYQTPYTPAYAGSPTTKKYVDDTITTSLEQFSFKDSSIYRWDGTTGTEAVTLFQKILDDYNAGKVVLILRPFDNDSSYLYVFNGINRVQPDINNQYILQSTPILENKSGVLGQQEDSGFSYKINTITITVDSNDNTRVSSLTSVNAENEYKFLETNANYQTPYTPLYNGSPATKKYVDDADTLLRTDIDLDREDIDDLLDITDDHTTRIQTAEGNITTAQGNITSLTTRVQALEDGSEILLNELPLITLTLSEFETREQADTLTDNTIYYVINDSLRIKKNGTVNIIANKKDFNDLVVELRRTSEIITGITVNAGGNVTLSYNYTVGSKLLDVFLNGEKLVGGLSTTAESACSYKEVGTVGTISNIIQITSDWNIIPEDIIEVIVYTRVLSNGGSGGSIDINELTQTLDERYVLQQQMNVLSNSDINDVMNENEEEG